MYVKLNSWACLLVSLGYVLDKFKWIFIQISTVFNKYDISLYDI